MMRLFPIKLVLKSMLAITLFSGVGYWIIFPMCMELNRNVTGIRYSYSGAEREISTLLEKEREILVSLERKLSPQTESGEKNTSYFDFIQKTIGKRGIQSSKITSGEVTTKKSLQQEDFTVSFTGKYHTIGIIISDLENGPFHCSIKSLHLFSRSLTESSLEADLQIFFSRINE